MANSYFKFKQFTIHQNKCAMKVCTDACLFGAIAAGKKLPSAKCLDVGTGTGLLSLMLAQKNKDIVIDAVEIDTDAALQATENITASAWADRITVINEDISTMKKGTPYDYIISNPPFFKNDLKSADTAVNNARHNTSLDLHQLIKIVDSKLADHGNFAVLLPYQHLNFFIEEAEKHGLYLSQQLLVKQTIKHKFFRSILFFKRSKSQTEYSEIIIKDTENNYTPEFSAVLKDYYLFL